MADPPRFINARDFMAYLGLVPSEHSSGQRRPTGLTRGQAAPSPEVPARSPGLQAGEG